MSLKDSKNWRNLEEHFSEISQFHLKDLFFNDPSRFEKYSIEFDNLLFDYSKNRIDENTLPLLIEMVNTCGLDKKIEALFTGVKINFTEKRAVLHTALRAKPDEEIIVDGINIVPEIQKVKYKMKIFSDLVNSGDWLGYSGKRITDVVNIGIGGSYLGPAMVCESLKAYKTGNLDVHFVSNIDSTDIFDTLKGLNPETTLFIIASKTFTTMETLTNANTAKNWFLNYSNAGIGAIAKHFVALSTNEKACKAYGIPKENMFEFWDWVGGRYSLWSAIGLSIALYLGFDKFEELLNGGKKMDNHFRTTDFDKNIPVIMALLSIWYADFFNVKTHAVIPYNQNLSRFPEFLQQLEMESNGKSTDSEGKNVDYSTGSVVWGTAGTNSQHSFFQLIHQGTQMIPVDFIAPVNSLDPYGDHHQKLLSNFFAQSEALMIGKNEEDVYNEMINQGLSDYEINLLLPHKVFIGNKPSNTILFEKITPEIIGMLIALYEHKVFVQGVIWNINSFDQWGVELGKQLALKIFPELNSEDSMGNHNSSTNGLINYYKKHKTN
jgi:glucose-6-phosphate isomerase